MTVRSTALLIGALAALWLAMLLLGAGDVDRDILLALYAGDKPGLALVALGLTFFGSWMAVFTAVLLGAALLIYRGNHYGALLLLIASFSGRALVIVEKEYFARLRPEEHMRLVEISSLSFPSGHSANSMIAYLGIALLVFDHQRHRRWAIAAALLLTFLVGLSRPMLGVHWPSDVVGGWSFGALWVLLIYAIAERWRAKS